MLDQTSRRPPEVHAAPETHEDGLGGSITILEEGDEVRPLRFRMVMPPGFGPPAPEHHPAAREDFRVLRGTLDLGMVEGKHVRLQAGDEFTLPVGASHHPKNGGDGELEFEATLTPGHDMAEMFRGLYAVSRRHSGLSEFVRVAMIFRRYVNVIAFPKPVALVMATVARLGRLFGVRAP